MHNSIEPSRLWNYIKRSDKEGFVMCASIVSQANIKENSASHLKAEGLVDNHAYS